MARTGRAVVAHGQDFDVREYPVPDPAPNTVLLRQELAGICGTDLHNWQNGFDREVLLGHENVGVIDAIGEGVKTDYVGNPIREGDRVILAPGTSYGAYGFQWNPDEAPHFRGGFADYIYLSYPNTCFIKTNASPEAAVMTEPFTVGVHAVMRGQVQIGDTVVVQGARCNRISDVDLCEDQRRSEANRRRWTREAARTRQADGCRCHDRH